jgi:4-amino-4-deoxy-L-arabinose transferase-like glycosyltransferase
MRTDPRRAVLLLIAVTTVIRLGWAAALEPSNDEAYHWLYAVHPAMSYFDHPPMLMWVEQFGIALCGGWVHPFSLRLGFVLLFAGSTWILFRWTADLYGDAAGFWAAVALNLSAYYTAVGGTFALPDSPFLFFALFTFWQATVALSPPLPPGERGVFPWLLVGVGFAGAMLSKYHAVLLPAGVVVYALVTPNRRKVLWSPGPYLAVLIGLIGFLPVVIWNANHEWASIRFQGGRAAQENVTPFLHEGPLKWLGGPIGYLLPWIWFWLVVELVRGVRRFRSLTGADRLLICLSVVPLVFFFLVSGRTRTVLPHWPLIGFVPLYPLLGRNWVRLREQYPRASKVFITLWTVILFGIAGFVLAQARFGLIPLTPTTKDPTADISGWESVADELDRRGILSEPNTFLFTNIWYDSGQLAFAVRGKVPVACYHSHDARGFAFWSRPDDYVGKTGFLVLPGEESDAGVYREYGPLFRRMTLEAEFPMTRADRPFRRVRVFRCEDQLRPYPFDYKGIAAR